MLEVKYLYEEGNKLMFSCDLNGANIELNHKELKRFIKAGQVENARLSSKKICLDKDTGIIYPYEANGYVVGELKRYDNMLKEIGKEESIYGSIYDVAKLFCINHELNEIFVDNDWHHPRLLPAINILLELGEHEDWNDNQQLPYVRQFHKIVKKFGKRIIGGI